MIGEFLLGGCGDMDFVRKHQRCGSLETIFLQLGTVCRIASLKLCTEGGVAEKTGLIVLGSQIVTEDVTLDNASVGASDAGCGTDRENKRDDNTAQQYREDNAEVMLEIFLDPRNHGEKPP